MERAHLTLLHDFLTTLPPNPIHRILDAGSGKTSLSAIAEHFPAAEVDAVVYPGDKRKLNSISTLVANHSPIHPIEADICTETLDSTYDLVIAHLLLGEATKFGNSFDCLLRRLLSIRTQYFIVIDYLEDPNVDTTLIESLCVEFHFEIIQNDCLANENPQVWDDFIGKHNFGYLIKRMNTNDTSQ